VPSDKYKCGYTLRFPRVQKIREDKSFEQCMTYLELIEMVRNFDGRLSSRKYGEVVDKEVKKRKKNQIKRTYSVMMQYQPIDISKFEVVSDLFNTLEFCIINGSDEINKLEIEKLIYQYGGTTVQHPRDNTYAIIAGKEVFKVKNLKSNGEWDIIHCKWIIDCIEKRDVNIIISNVYDIH